MSLTSWIGLPPLRVLHPPGRSGARFRVEAPHVALTFDDGPHPERTPAILDCVARHGVRATFFLVGERARRSPRLVRRIADEGHSVANHSWSHRVLVGADDRRLFDEVDRTQQVLADLLGRAPTLFRPPYGFTTCSLERILRERHLTPVFWSVDSFDFAAVPASVSFRHASRAGRGDVVLFHDGVERARGTLKAVDRWLTGAREVGLP
ncbi:MAG: polysaccharide deacetylase family protein, partial [Myxococcaceae bacterium]